MGINQAISGSQAGEQRYRHLFDNIPICIFVVDVSVTPAVILEVNHQTELVYGYMAVEVIGNPITHLMAEESRESAQNILQLVQRGETVTNETIHRHRDGTAFPARVIATLDPINRGCMIVTVENITAEIQRRVESDSLRVRELIESIAAVYRRHYPIVSTIIKECMVSESHPVMQSRLQNAEKLTASEMTILRLVARGVENERIAQVLNYSVYTVANRLRTIYAKLHLTNRTQAALYALRQGWATLDEPLV